jgi:hypothetical protein
MTTSPVLDAYKLSDDILDLLDDAVMTYVTEAELQAEIARVLVAEGIDARREVRLSDGRSRIDLLRPRRHRGQDQGLRARPAEQRRSPAPALRPLR